MGRWNGGAPGFPAPRGAVGRKPEALVRFAVWCCSNPFSQNVLGRAPALALAISCARRKQSVAAVPLSRSRESLSLEWKLATDGGKRAVEPSLHSARTCVGF